MTYVSIFLATFVLIADRLSKLLTDQYLPLMQGNFWYPYGGIGVFKNFLGIEFSINHHINRGAAWGIFADYQVPLLYLRLILILGLIVFLIFFNKHKSCEIPFSLIIAGALSNVLDYFFYGHVIDMIHFNLWGYDFPVFNLADTAIFIGIFWQIATSLLEKKKHPICQ
jgi:signal peptidase II